MTTQRLVEYFKHFGEFEIRITDKTKINDGVYAEEGMVGKIIAVKYDFNDVYDITIDWNGYEDINEPLEAKNWKIGEAMMPMNLGTMKEAGMYPDDGKEAYYSELLFDNGFELFNYSLVGAFEEYEKIETKDTFASWISQKAGF